VRRWSVTALALLAGCVRGGAPVVPAQRAAAAALHAPMVIRNQHHRSYAKLQLTTPSGDCLQILDSSDITIANSQIGPCGGNAVSIGGGGSIRIYDSYIHPETRSTGCCDTHDGILAEHTHDVTIGGDVIAYAESNVEALQHVSGLTVVGNFLLNPRGPYPRGQNVQAWNAGDVVVRNNYTLDSRDTHRFLFPGEQEDSINFGRGSGFTAKQNFVSGGRSKSGCGLIADDAANHVAITWNAVVDSGQCGIGIASGSGQLVEGNRVLNRTPVRDGGNTAIYVWNQYPSVACGPVIIAHNVATEIRKDGSQSGFWNGGGCSPVRMHRNIWNARAEKLLTPPNEKMPPPEIPPQPKTCVARSPYSTQTGWPACGG
jgi:hypothetical protein